MRCRTRARACACTPPSPRCLRRLLLLLLILRREQAGVRRRVYSPRSSAQRNITWFFFFLVFFVHVSFFASLVNVRVAKSIGAHTTAPGRDRVFPSSSRAPAVDGSPRDHHTAAAGAAVVQPLSVSTAAATPGRSSSRRANAFAACTRSGTRAAERVRSPSRRPRDNVVRYHIHD